MTIDHFPQGVFFLLPFHLMPDHLPVDHLPWVFRDVAHYGGIGPPDTLRRRCVYVKSVGDEIYINIQHIGIHWLVERTQTKKSTSYPFHDFQRVDCVKHGPGPRYVVSYGDSDPFSIPSAIYRFNDNRPENLILHEEGHRLQFAKNVGLPYVLMMIKEEHYQKGEYRKDKTKQYIVSVDPHRIHIQIPVKGYKYDRIVENYNKGKRWDKILERGYLRDSEYSVCFTPDLSKIPRFDRETNYLEKADDGEYQLQTGYKFIEKAQEEKLDVILALYSDILIVDNATVAHHNKLYELKCHREHKEHGEMWERSLAGK
jgi:hypothetical protein